MNLKNKFMKVSASQFFKDIAENVPVGEFEAIDLGQMYDDIKVPKRATKFSAGYDFYAPYDFELQPNETIKFPTGIRVSLEQDKFLALVPRSSLGFKYRTQLDNTIGIIDADYFYSDNEGHIWVKITNDSHRHDILKVKKGEAYMQGIILQYCLTEDDDVEEVRNGGFGSTNK